MVDEGCIHGRFQPFHNEHLEYAQAALERCYFLWIGLADHDALESDQSAASSTPLNYRERQFMITRTLVSEGIAPERFSFIPFPLHTPDLLPNFLDPQATCFVTINDERNRQDCDLVRKSGYPVEVLYERPKGISASDIRNLLIAGDDLWQQLVPSSAVAYLEEIELAERLRELQREHPHERSGQGDMKPPNP
jgi:nicotinamide mononucleotide adenylyltransferase